MSVAIQLPLREDQTEFNLRIWQQLLAEPALAKIEGRIETDRHGQIIMTPPPGPPHGTRQGDIYFHLRLKLGGRPVTECPISTSDGVKAADVGWFSDVRYARAFDRRCFLEAPEICVEVLSPSNSSAEMEEKKALYFDAGADEVWFCEEDGTMRFHCSGLSKSGHNLSEQKWIPTRNERLLWHPCFSWLPLGIPPERIGLCWRATRVVPQVR